MNRSILIVICDFLLVSLLIFSSLDINRVAGHDPEPVRTAQAAPATNQVSSADDLTAAMQMALEEERRRRAEILRELDQSRQTSSQQEAMLREREERLRNIQRELQTRQQELQTREQQAQQLQQQQTELQQQLTAAQSSIQNLGQQLKRTSTETILTKEQLAAVEAEAREKAEQAAALERQLAQLARSNQVILAERQRLASELQVAEAEKRHATEQVARMTDQVIAERQEKAQFAEGFKALATTSGELVEEIRENRPLAPNTIFSEFMKNRVPAEFVASRTGLFGNEAVERKDAQTVLVSNGTNLYAVCHVTDTPLSLWAPTAWEGFTAMLGRPPGRTPVQTMYFHDDDPRIVFIPLTEAEAQSLGGKAYRTSSDPYKFQDAVLIGAQEGYYGECRFEIDLSTPDYVKLDRSVLRGLFGKFNPTRGDLVFSKNGELLGIMANSTYCLMLRNFDAAAVFRLGPSLRPQGTVDMLSLLSWRVTQMPTKLQ